MKSKKAARVHFKAVFPNLFGVMAHFELEEKFHGTPANNVIKHIFI